MSKAQSITATAELVGSDGSRVRTITEKCDRARCNDVDCLLSGIAAGCCWRFHAVTGRLLGLSGYGRSTVEAYKTRCPRCVRVRSSDNLWTRAFEARPADRIGPIDGATGRGRFREACPSLPNLNGRVLAFRRTDGNRFRSVRNPVPFHLKQLGARREFWICVAACLGRLFGYGASTSDVNHTSSFRKVANWRSVDDVFHICHQIPHPRPHSSPVSS